MQSTRRVISFCLAQKASAWYTIQTYPQTPRDDEAFYCFEYQPTCVAETFDRRRPPDLHMTFPISDITVRP